MMSPRSAQSIASGAASVLLAACASTGPRLLADHQPHATRLTVDLTYVYWTTQQGQAASLMKVFKDEKAPAVQVTSLQGKVQALAVDDDGIYLSVGGDEGPTAIKKIPKKKGVAWRELVNAPGRITSIGMDATHVYWTQTGKAGEPDDNRTPGVLRVMRAGGTPLNLAPNQPGVPGGVTLNATHVFWVNAEPGLQHTIVAVRKAGGAPVTLAVVPEVDTGGTPALAADDSFVFYKTRTAILRVSAQGGEPAKVASTPESEASALAIDARHVYFLGPRGPMRLPQAGGTAMVMADAPGSAMAIDAQSVYWLSSGRVMQVPKE